MLVVLLAAAAAVARDLLLYHCWTGTAVSLGDVGEVFSAGDGGGADWWYLAVVVEVVELVVLGAVDVVDDGDEDEEDGGEGEGVRVERVMLVMVMGCVGDGGGGEEKREAHWQREREGCLSLLRSQDEYQCEVERGDFAWAFISCPVYGACFFLLLG